MGSTRPTKPARENHVHPQEVERRLPTWRQKLWRTDGRSFRSFNTITFASCTEPIPEGERVAAIAEQRELADAATALARRIEDRLGVAVKWGPGEAGIAVGGSATLSTYEVWALTLLAPPAFYYLLKLPGAFQEIHGLIQGLLKRLRRAKYATWTVGVEAQLLEALRHVHEQTAGRLVSEPSLIEIVRDAPVPGEKEREQRDLFSIPDLVGRKTHLVVVDSNMVVRHHSTLDWLSLRAQHARAPVLKEVAAEMARCRTSVASRQRSRKPRTRGNV